MDDPQLTLYKEHREHARHLEKERMWLGNFIIAIVTVFITVHDKITLISPVLSTILLMVFVLIAFLITIKLNVGFGLHMRISDNIMDELNAKNIRPNYESSRYSWIKISRLFLLIYAVSFNALLSLFFILIDYPGYGLTFALLLLSVSIIFIFATRFYN